MSLYFKMCLVLSVTSNNNVFNVLSVLLVSVK